MAIADYGLREYDDGDVISRFLFLLWSISTDFIYIYVLSYNYHNAISISVPSYLYLARSLQTNQRPVSLQGTLIDQVEGSSPPHTYLLRSTD